MRRSLHGITVIGTAPPRKIFGLVAVAARSNGRKF
jgi:hypothetical protein